jgi:Tol biopolymer transport system component
VIAFDGLAQSRPATVMTVVGRAEPRATVDGAWGGAVSPDGRRLAYMRGEGHYDDGVLFVRDESGSEWRVADHASTVAWSPTGDWLAYEVVGPSVAQNDLWIVRPDGTGSRRLTAPDQQGRFEAWAPDGSRLAFGIFPPESENATEQSRPSLARIVLLGTDGSSRELAGMPAGGWSPVAWSPDGSKLLVNVYEDAIGWIASVDVANGTLLRLSHPSGGRSDSGIGWSPDGTAVLFRRDRNDEFFDLWLAKDDGREPRLLVTGVTEAVWGPTGD